MPILIKDYEWNQTNSRIQVLVNNVQWNKNSDYILSNQYFKANYGQQNIFELFLENEINVSQSKMSVNGQNLLIDLCKEEVGKIWTCLNLSDSLTRKEKLNLRLNSQNWIQNYQKDLCTKHKENSCKLERKSIEKAMERDENSQKDIQRQKNITMDKFLSSEQNLTKSKENCIDKRQDKSLGKIYDTSLLVQVAVDQDRIKPPIRSPGCIMVSFTERRAPTPLRENNDDKAGEWLRKKWETYAKKEGIQSSEGFEDLQLSQVLEKGKRFMLCGDILSAVSIYTHGIKIYPKAPALYNNRAIAYLQLQKNYSEALKDTNEALALLSPPVQNNLNQRAKAYLRKSYIMFKQGHIDASIHELEIASKLIPENKEIAEQLAHLQHYSDDEEYLIKLD